MKNNSLYVTFGIVIFLIASIVFVAIFSRLGPSVDEVDNYYSYNGFAFQKAGSVWMTSVTFRDQPYDITVYYGPRDVGDVQIEDGLFRVIFDRDPIYFALDDTALTAAGNGTPAKGALAAIELAKIIGTRNNILNKQTMTGLANPTDAAEPSLPVLSCANATSEIGVIVFTIGDTERVFEQEPGCIVVEGRNGDNLIRASDRMMLQLTGIMLE